MGSSRANALKSDGFSLTELLIVVAILGIMAGIAVPTTAGIDESRVNQASTEVAQALRFARDYSIATDSVYAVSLNQADERIRVLRYDTSVIPAVAVYDVRHPLSKKIWDLDFDDYGPALGVNIETARTYLTPCTLPFSSIRFDAGEVVKCSVPASARVDEITVTLTRDSATATVVVDGLTGRVSVP